MSEPTRELGAAQLDRDDAGRDVARVWAAFERRGWQQGDPFPPDLEEALDRLAAAHGVDVP